MLVGVLAAQEGATKRLRSLRKEGLRGPPRWARGPWSLLVVVVELAAMMSRRRWPPSCRNLPAVSYLARIDSSPGGVLRARRFGGAARPRTHSVRCHRRRFPTCWRSGSGSGTRQVPGLPLLRRPSWPRLGLTARRSEWSELALGLASGPVMGVCVWLRNVSPVFSPWWTSLCAS